LVVRPGDRVRFDGQVQTVAGLSGMLVRLADEAGGTSTMHLPTLMISPGFEVLGSGNRRVMPAGLLDHVPAAQTEEVLWWHRHMVELRTGLPPDAPQGVTPRPEYDPATRTLVEREASKAAELSAELGRPVSAHTVRGGGAVIRSGASRAWSTGGMRRADRCKEGSGRKSWTSCSS
jgi:hypothetical protein